MAAEQKQEMLGDSLAKIARICHEANRAYCKTLGDESQLPWDEAPGWQRDSCIQGVRARLMNLSAPVSASHQGWLAHKEKEGWKYGPVKDAEKKEHPCFLPYEHLPEEQKRKDMIFTGIVLAMTHEVAD